MVTMRAQSPVVLVDCGHIRNLAAGLGQVARQFAGALQSGNQQEFDFRFLAHPRFHEFRRGIGAQHCVSPSFSLAGAVMRVFNKEWQRYAYRETGHAVRHAIHRNCYQIPAADRAPFVLTIHDMHLMHEKPKRRKHSLKRLQQLANRASAVGFISEYAKRAACEHINFGGAEQRIIYNGVNKPANAQKPQWFSQMENSDTRPFLFSVAQIAPSKNYHIMPAVMRRLPETNLIIAGNKKKYYAPQIEENARKEGVGARVVLPGKISEGEKAWLLEHCAGFVFPSLREGFGMPVVEALHFGKAVFCFRNTALPEVGGEHAFYWQDDSPQTMAELIQTTLAAEQKTNDKAQARMSWAAKFSWQDNAAAYVDIYRRLTKQ